MSPHEFSTDDSNYKRAEDQRWRELTNDRVVALTSSETVQNGRLDEIEERLDSFRELLEGKDGDKNDNGIKGDVHENSVRLSRLEALMAPDNLGEGGIINRLKKLEKRAEGEEKAAEHRGRIYLAIIAATATITGAIVSNLDKIKTFFNKPVVHSVAEDFRQKKQTPRVRRIKYVPPPPIDEDE